MTDPDAEARGFIPPRTHRLWRDVLLPRTTFPAFWLAWLALIPARLLRRRRPSAARVVLESGRVGWTHVYFEELWQSAAEYLGAESLVRAVIDRDAPYLPQFHEWSADSAITHAVLDTRTGPQEWGASVRAALSMAWRLLRAGVTPVVVLPDPSLRRQRLAAAILTAHSGVVVSFMSTRQSAPMFPHRRILGPQPMPVSLQRLAWLEGARADGVPQDGPRVRFIGGMYPPRSVFLDRLGARLAARGITLEVHADKYGTSNDDYWRVLAASDVIVTTTMQGMPRADMDWIWITQLVFRFSEALSAGAVLAAQKVEGADLHFAPGEDFVPFLSLDEAESALVSLVTDDALRERIRESGHVTARRLATEHVFWAEIDAALGPDAMRRPGER